MTQNWKQRPQRPRPTPKKISGLIQVTRSGKGFFLQETGDIEVPREWVNTALSGDTVEVSLERKYGKQMARVVRVIERKSSRFVGTIEDSPEGIVLKPDDQRIRIHFLVTDAHPKDIGMKAVIDVTDWGSLLPTASVQQIIGKAGDHETEMRAIVAARGFDMTFSEVVLNEAQALYENAWDEEEIQTREDFRDTLTFTIDPDDAKDFDDAISYKELEKGAIEIGVHIADVSHFVRPGTAIDDEAFKRATSIYLVDRTIPMLPPQLSEDLCSLRPDTDRLTFSAVFTIDAENNVIGRRFTKGIINSKRRFTYDEADKGMADSAHDFYPIFSRVWSFASHLRNQRFKNGAIMFDRPEIKPILNDKKEVVAFKLLEYTDSHKLIEDLMLLANREVAAYVSNKLGKKNRIFIYRVHEAPNAEKIDELVTFLRAIGHPLSISPNGITQQDLNALFKSIEGTPEEQLIRTAAVRSMSKAVYSAKNIGHFGLAFDNYTHFTSPIRRYPDLMVHRTLFELISGREVNINPETHAQQLVHTSEKEAAASEAERVSIKRKQVEYFAHLIGQERTGVVSGVTEWGIYISDKETNADGMVRLMSMTDDQYELDRKSYSVIGKTTNNKIRLGDEVTFTVERVDIDEQTIDLKLA